MSSSSDDKSIRSGHYENATVDDDEKFPLFFFVNVFSSFLPSQQLAQRLDLCIYMQIYIKGKISFIYPKQNSLSMQRDGKQKVSSLVIYRICEF